MVAPPAANGSSSQAASQPAKQNNQPLSARKAQKLEMSTVERRGQPTQAPEIVKRSRPFGLQEAPTFRPTEEEFKNPMEYIKSIFEEGKKYGIVKVIPPASFNPDFAIDTERFHFRTRRQELNSVEGGTRANLNYLDQLAKFHKQITGTNLNRFPSVDKRPLDLYKLKKLVEVQGGFERVCKQKKWAEIGRLLGYSGKIMSSLSTSLKNSYQKWLLPYETYLQRAKPGVLQQQELDNGGPYTPSPGPSPMKTNLQGSPPLGNGDSPAMRASMALHANLHDRVPAAAPTPPTHESPKPAMSSGFTPVNAGGFTAVNAPKPSSFPAINAPNGNHQFGTGHSTPQRSVESPFTSAKNTPEFPPTSIGLAPIPPGHSTHMKRHISSEYDGFANGDSDSGRRSKRVKMEPAPPTVAGSHMTQPRLPTNVARLHAPRDRTKEKPGDKCEGCGTSDNPPAILLCDSCDSGYHKYCLDPPLKSTPDYEWHCPRCLVGPGGYGFEEGSIYSLRQFQDQARKFRIEHFQNKANAESTNGAKNQPAHITEEQVEKEFWRLAESLTETVEVEYGADIHSTINGSGFPTMERNPRDPYSTDPWNLNVLPLDKESLFRHIKTDISGMTVPWLYVGMVFSCFCWHAEDHHTYSANYQHFGATKTWYGIPAEDAEKFESAMREAVPELFESDPDLLFQLTTLITPDQLRKAGLRVYAADQRAGQFIITFPQAYHSGFNHGFNMNEAVNFAPSDWEPYGEAAVQKLRDFRRQPVFSHDELLLSAASRDHTIKTARWLGPALERTKEREMDARQHFFIRSKSAIDGASVLMESTNGNPDSNGTNNDIAIEPFPVDLPEDSEICAYCKTSCHLSRFVCKKSSTTTCLLHAGVFECCEMSPDERYRCARGLHTLQYRLSDGELEDKVQKVVDLARTPEVWSDKLEKLLDDGPDPSLKNMRTLLAEGEKINAHWPLEQLPDLRKFVERCNEWVEEATNYITRKQQNRRKNERAWRKSNAAKAAELEERDRELRKVDNIKKLLKDAASIGFDCAEIHTLQDRADSIANFRRKAESALQNPSSKPISELDELVEEGKSFNVDMDEIKQLDKVVQQLKWYDEARNAREKIISLQDVVDFIKQGTDLGIPETDQYILHYKEQKSLGDFWESKAKELMAVENIHYQQLDALFKQAQTLPVSKETLAALDAMLKKQREAQEKILNLYEQSKDPDFSKRPRYKDVRDAMEALSELNSKPNGTLDLEKEQKRHEDWMRRGKKLFGKANAPLHILLQHMQIVETRNDACFHLEDVPKGIVEPASREPTPAFQDFEFGDMNVFCICRRAEAGMMIKCDLCSEWYHGKCLKIARGKVKDDDKYTCPICDYRVKIPRDAARPKLEDLQNWQEEIPSLPFRPEEEDCLNNIVNTALDFRDELKSFINPVLASPDDLSNQRFYLRKLEGADILLADETNYFRQELHKWAPVAPKPPPLIDVSLSTRKARPTKQQKIMAQLGIEKVEDLPPHLRPKTIHTKSRKASEAAQGALPSQKPPHQSQSLKPTSSSRSHTPPGLPRGMSMVEHSNSNRNSVSSGMPPTRRESPHFSFGDHHAYDSPHFGPSMPYSQAFQQQPPAVNSGVNLDPALFSGDTAAFDRRQDYAHGHNHSSSQGGASDLFSSLTNQNDEATTAGPNASLAADALRMVQASRYENDREQSMEMDDFLNGPSV
ncbi:histone demethylase JARID1D [Aulographum hederae CBS 113979]|uniref:Histone demethylase JARID1D n=1 Tax=Aulographum hederae CBS 113979 TaxID=1176131 RepID=A0A6G1HDJ8_9PEZI|nr:histone demethylase JARID1D [Aulographum hederae CBS 113979]